MNQHAFYGPGFHPGMGHFPVPYPLPGYPMLQPPPGMHVQQWHPGFHPHYPQFAPPMYPPPNYPPPQIPAPLDPVAHVPLAIAVPQPAAPPPIIQAAKEEHLRPSAQRVLSVHDHTNSSDMDWPTGFVRRECIAGEEPRKWKHNNWVWRSNGTVLHDGHAAEVRLCLGVLRCDTCQHLIRPKTQPSARKAQIDGGCTERTCKIDAALIHDTCTARTYHYKMDRNGSLVRVWEHFGDHATHNRPPGGTLTKAQEDMVDAQVMRRHEASAHELRTGDPGPGSVPLPNIAPILAAPSSARYHLAQSQTRLGINTGSSKGGLAFMGAFGDLSKRLSTPFIIDSCLSGPVYMTFQTPFMDTILREAVDSWILDLRDGPEASRHGIVIDGDHTFFRQGPLLASCAFSAATRQWTPILYSWINGQDKAHHRPHFAHIFKSIIKHAGDRFDRRLLLCVMDFSGAQRGAHAEEYAEAVISTMPHFSQLSKEAQDTERRQLIIEAEQAEFYPARVAGITSTGGVRMEWYQDNIYEQKDKPLESEFVCSKDECATAAAVECDVVFDRNNVGAIKWPPRLAEDASQNFGYENPEISSALLASRSAIAELVLWSDLTRHPILSDYEEWMDDAPQLGEAKHAERFGDLFQSAEILDGDASLIEVHATHVFNAVTAAHTEAGQAFPEHLRLRANILIMLLLKLTIFRIYLRRPIEDDRHVYFFARFFTMEELLDITEMDPHAVAKKGQVIRNLTIPEVVLQVPEASYGGRSIPLRWCKIGAVVRKTAAARIPPNFVHATAYCADGEEYMWNQHVVVNAPTRESSPLSDLPGSPMEVEVVSEALDMATRGVKRAREHDSDDEIEPRAHPRAHPVPLRRSTRSRGRKVG
ncbi:hypothetical protein DFH06DRAFT_1379863 [Mycena polygramma]|nr:hypothetical protein DFH06DRAFT_1379863 [Mycena polygramma]